MAEFNCHKYERPRNFATNINRKNLFNVIIIIRGVCFVIQFVEFLEE